MENTPLSKTEHGLSTIEIPDSLIYPTPFPLATCNQLRGVFCYVLKKYPIDGISLVLVRTEGIVSLRLADFAGNLIQIEQWESHRLGSYIKQIMGDNVRKLIEVSKYIGIPKAQFYFSADNGVARLIDLRLSINKYVGPGFIQDFFAKIVPIQEKVGDPIILDDQNMELLLEHKGPYTGEYILKPSSFKTIMDKDNILPLYGEISHAPKSVT